MNALLGASVEPEDVMVSVAACRGLQLRRFCCVWSGRKRGLQWLERSIVGKAIDGATGEVVIGRRLERQAARSEPVRGSKRRWLSKPTKYRRALLTVKSLMSFIYQPNRECYNILNYWIVNAECFGCGTLIPRGPPQSRPIVIRQRYMAVGESETTVLTSGPVQA